MALRSHVNDKGLASPLPDGQSPIRVPPLTSLRSCSRFARKGIAKRRGVSWLCQFALIAAHALFYFPYFSGRLAFGSDVVLQNYPLRVLTQSLAKLYGGIPWWNAYAFSGMPLCGTFASLCFYPPARATFFLPPALAMNLLIVFHSLLGSGAAVAAFRCLGYGAAASLGGALLWAFGGFTMQRLSAGHVDALATVHWFPLIALCWIRYARERRARWVVAAGCALALQILAGYPQYVYLAHAAGLPVWLLFFGKDRRAWAMLGAYLALGLALSAAQWMPGLSILRESVRALAHDEAFYFAYSASWRDFWNLFVPHAFGDGIAVPYGTEAYGWEVTLYLGLPALYFVARADYQDRSRRWLLGCALAFLLLAAGGHTGGLYRTFVRVVPLASWFRVPGRYLFSAFALFVPLVVDGLQRWADARADPRRTAAFAVAVLALAGAGFATTAMPGALAVAAALALALVALDFPAARARLPAASLAGIAAAALFADLWSAHARFVRTIPLSRFADLGFAPKEGRIFSLDADLKFQTQAMMHRKPHVAGYDPMVPRRYNEFLSLALGLPAATNQAVFLPKEFPPLLGAAAARWIVTDRPLFSATMPLYGRQGDVLVYQNPAALPRFHFVKEVRPATAAQAREAMRVAWPELRSRAYAADGAEPRAYAAGGEVALEEDRGDSIRLSFAPADAPRFLVIHDNDYPGWTARAGGAPAAIVPVNGFMKGIEIPAGATEATLAFRPARALLGGWISFGGWLAVGVAGAGLALRRAKKRSQAEREEVADRA